MNTLKKDRQHTDQKKKDKHVHRSTKHTHKNKVCCVYTITPSKLIPKYLIQIDCFL